MVSPVANDIRLNEVVLAQVLFEASTEAVGIIAQRISDDARPLTHVLRTRPPGRKQWSYSLPAGRLRDSIGWEPGTDGHEPYADIGVNARGIPLAYFQGLGGGDAAYGGSRSHTASILDATELQIGRPVP